MTLRLLALVGVRAAFALLLAVSSALGVVSSTTNVVQYTGTGTTATYAVPFKFFQNSDLSVQETTSGGVTTTLVLTTDYTLAGANIPTGGTITLTAGNLPTGTLLTIQRDPLQVQNLLLQQGAPFNPGDLMNALDLLTMEVQATRQRTNNAIQVPLSESLLGLTLTLPTQTLRANKWLAFDSSGNPIPVTGSGPVLPSTFYYDVTTFGADRTGASDSAPGIQAAINAAAAAGGGIVYLPAGTYKVSSTLIINKPGVQLIGANADTNHSVSFTPGGTILSWSGSSGGTMLQVYTPNGATSPAVSNVVVKGIKFSCNGTAGIAIEALSLAFCAFEDINVYNPTLEAFHLTCQAQTEVTSLRRCTFKRISIRCLDGVGANAHGFVCDGNANGNVSFNTFEDVAVVHKNGDGIRILDGDSNLFLGTYTFRATGGTGYGLSLYGGSVANLTARSNHFIQLSANGGVYAYGTSSYTVGSQHNNIWFYDRENGNPDPTVETGATLYLHDSSGTWEKPLSTGAVFSDSRATGETERTNLGTETARIRNDSDNHIRVVDQNANEWSININHATGNLRLYRVTGNGAVEIGSNGADVIFNGHRVTYTTAAPASGTWNAGDRSYNSAPAVGQPKSWVCTVGGTPGTWVSEGNL